jgi:hypothetical protein
MEWMFYMWSFFGFMAFMLSAALPGRVAALSKEVTELKAQVEALSAKASE